MNLSDVKAVILKFMRKKVKSNNNKAEAKGKITPIQGDESYWTVRWTVSYRLFRTHDRELEHQKISSGMVTAICSHQQIWRLI